MLWIFLFLRKTYNARTGVWPFDFGFNCAHCGAQAMARVFAQGFGSCTTMSNAYTGQAIAEANAARNIQAAAQSSLARAACPCCGKFSPAVMGYAEHAAAARAESERTRWTWALGAAGVVLFLALVGAGADKSVWLGLTGLCGALVIGLLTFVTKTPKIAGVREVHPQNVSFWWNNGFVTPQVVYTPQEDATVARSSGLATLCYGGSTLLGLGMITMFALWVASFHDVYVVNTQSTGDLDVRVDGKSVGTVSSIAGVKDAPSESFTVRNGTHVIEAYSGTVLVERRDLHFGSVDPGYVFAPNGKQNGACFVRVVSTYRKTDDAPAPVSERFDDDLFQAKWDDAFVSSPASVTMDENTSETKRAAIRAFACKNGRIVRDQKGEEIPFASNVKR